jgi:hypothetical protein
MRRLSGLFFAFTTLSATPLLAQKDTTIPKNQIEITGDKKGVISGKGIQKSEILTENEFKKAACCTLSESFETTNTLEVSNADGVSGIRQIEMLGLAGKYVQMSQSNMPSVRGLSVLTGLSHIPGPMVSAVHLAKGTGSVSEGFEGLTGGINYALKQEPTEPRLFLNAYLINGGARLMPLSSNELTTELSATPFFTTVDNGKPWILAVTDSRICPSPIAFFWAIKFPGITTKMSGL